MGEFKHILATEPGPHETVSENSKQNRKGKERKAHSCVRVMLYNQPVLCMFTVAKI